MTSNTFQIRTFLLAMSLMLFSTIIAAQQLVVTADIQTPVGDALTNVPLILLDDSQTAITFANPNDQGQYVFTDLDPTQTYYLQPSYDVNPLNGVSAFDLVVGMRHILGTSIISNPYALLSLDTNLSGTVSVFDLVPMRQLILAISPVYPVAPSWVFAEPNAPQNTIAPRVNKVIIPAGTTQFNLNLIAVKMGDPTFSAIL